MPIQTDELTKKLFAELGVEHPDEALVADLEDHFEKVILEVFLRRAPETRLREVKVLIDSNDPALPAAVMDIATTIPGLAEEIEAAVEREYEAIKSMMAKR